MGERWCFIQNFGDVGTGRSPFSRLIKVRQPHCRQLSALYTYLYPYSAYSVLRRTKNHRISESSKNARVVLVRRVLGCKEERVGCDATVNELTRAAVHELAGGESPISPKYKRYRTQEAHRCRPKEVATITPHLYLRKRPAKPFYHLP